MGMIKENPGKSVTAAISIVGAAFSAYLFLESHYASAADVARLDTKMDVSNLSRDVATLELTREIVEVKLDDINSRRAGAKPGQPLNSVDQANLEKYQGRTRSLGDAINAKKALIDQLQAGMKPARSEKP